MFQEDLPVEVLLAGPATFGENDTSTRPRNLPIIFKVHGLTPACLSRMLRAECVKEDVLPDH